MSQSTEHAAKRLRRLLAGFDDEIRQYGFFKTLGVVFAIDSVGEVTGAGMSFSGPSWFAWVAIGVTVAALYSLGELVDRQRGLTHG